MNQVPEESAEPAGYVPMEQDAPERTHRVIGAKEGTSNARFILVAKGTEASEYLAVDSLFKKTEKLLRDVDYFTVKKEMRPYGKGWGLMSGMVATGGGKPLGVPDQIFDGLHFVQTNVDNCTSFMVLDPKEIDPKDVVTELCAASRMTPSGFTIGVEPNPSKFNGDYRDKVMFGTDAPMECLVSNFSLLTTRPSSYGKLQVFTLWRARWPRVRSSSCARMVS